MCLFSVFLAQRWTRYELRGTFVRSLLAEDGLFLDACRDSGRFLHPIALTTTCFFFVTCTGRSAQRLEADVDRAVQNLETRIRRLLSAVAGAGGGEEDDSSTGSSPPSSSIQRKGSPYPSEDQESAAGAGAGTEAAGVEVETHLV